ncbi:MAG: DUF21 domain-containing protein [Phycisphaerales bacterium]|nr:DUF21 domain-containing protein [Phycisphaerales bacterium]
MNHPSDVLLYIAIALGGMMLAGIASGIETGIYTLSRVRLFVRAARGDSRAIILERELKTPERVISTTLLLQAAGGWIGGLGIASGLEAMGLSTLAATLAELAILTPLLFIMGDVMPKELFRTNSDRWLPTFARPLLVLRVICTWTGIIPVLSWIASTISTLTGASKDGAPIDARQRVFALLHEDSESLSEQQMGIAERVFTMRGVTIGAEMVPWKQVAILPVATSAFDRLELLRRTPFSRLPAVDAQGAVVGIVTALDVLLSPAAQTMKLLKPVPVLPPHTPALTALSEMRSARVTFAIVAERPDKPLGIVTIKDLVEPLVGDLAAW